MVSAQVGIIGFQFTAFFGRTGLVAFTLLVAQFMAILVAFTDVLMDLAFVLTDFLPVAPEFGIALGRQVRGMNNRYGGEREDGTDRGKFQLQHDVFLL